MSEHEVNGLPDCGCFCEQRRYLRLVRSDLEQCGF